MCIAVHSGNERNSYAIDIKGVEMTNNALAYNEVVISLNPIWTTIPINKLGSLRWAFLFSEAHLGIPASRGHSL